MNEYFTWSPNYIYDNISLNSSQNEKCFGENQNTHFMFNKFFYENRDVYEIMWKKNMIESERPQMTM
jgi:hypothetical protein